MWGWAKEMNLMKAQKFINFEAPRDNLSPIVEFFSQGITLGNFCQFLSEDHLAGIFLKNSLYFLFYLSYFISQRSCRFWVFTCFGKISNLFPFSFNMLKLEREKGE